jgi:hypothetical protein
MKVDLAHQNIGLVSLFDNPSQIITLDANFFIPPSRNIPGVKPFGFDSFRRIWLDPLFECFSKLAIHEAVREELIMENIKTYIDNAFSDNPPKLLVHIDDSLNAFEKVLRNTYESQIAPYTKYVLSINNKSDRGEVKSLSYLAVKALLYFAAHDSVALSLIQRADSLNTGLDNLCAIQMYEIIFYMIRLKVSSPKDLRMLYKYQYHLTKSEKSINPEWNIFLTEMDKLYTNQ